MINFDFEYLDKDQIAGFDKYKYRCKDTGLLSIYVMHPFWNWLVQFVPKWVAPNLITFVGFLFTVALTLMFMMVDYGFFSNDPQHPEAGPLPNWMFTVGAVFIFLAYTLDGVDGKQARKTGTSGPLGELFDHGLDSYSAGLVPLSIYTIFGRDEYVSMSPYRFFLMLANILGCFYSPHFEKYNTGLLFLPWAYDFSMWGTIIVFATTGFFGADLWRFSWYGLKPSTIFEIAVYGSALTTNFPVIAYNIHKSYKEKTGCMRSFSEAVRPLTSPIILFILFNIWILFSPGNIIESDPRMIYLILATIFSNICCRLIVAEMSSSRCEAFNGLLVPLILVIFIILLIRNALIELFLAYTLFAFSTMAHIHYGTCVVRQMCRHFKIDCFRIKKIN